MDEAVERRLARWGARLADAGKDTAAGEQRLDRAAERVLAIARRIEEIAAPPEATVPGPPAVDPAAITRSNDDAPADDEAPRDEARAGAHATLAGPPRRATGATAPGRRGGHAGAPRAP